MSDFKQCNVAEVEEEGRKEVECYDWHYDEECESCQRKVELMKNLLKESEYGSKIEVQGQQMLVAEGDVLKDIKDVRVVEESQQLKSEKVDLDRELDGLWRVMQRHSKRMCSMKKKEMNCLNSLTE